jgi:choline-phosphate cytidylyltransferase
MQTLQSFNHLLTDDYSKWVDEVVEDAPWIVTQPFMDEHKIDFVAHGEDIILDEHGVDIYKFVKDQGRYRTIKRTEGISTSDIILRIVKYVISI